MGKFVSSGTHSSTKPNSASPSRPHERLSRDRMLVGVHRLLRPLKQFHTPRAVGKSVVPYTRPHITTAPADPRRIGSLAKYANTGRNVVRTIKLPAKKAVPTSTAYLVKKNGATRKVAQRYNRS